MLFCAIINIQPVPPLVEWYQILMMSFLARLLEKLPPDDTRECDLPLSRYLEKIHQKNLA